MSLALITRLKAGQDLWRLAFYERVGARHLFLELGRLLLGVLAHRAPRAPSEHLERARFEHVTAAALDRARAVQALAALHQIAPADRALPALMRQPRAIVVALGYRLAAICSEDCSLSGCTMGRAHGLAPRKLGKNAPGAMGPSRSPPPASSGGRHTA